LANSIRFMLSIDDDQLAAYRKPKASQASNIGNYLAAKSPEHPIAMAIVPFGKSSVWRKSSDYRNRWTHEQPPTLARLGLAYRRTRRWKNGTLSIGGSDAPEYTVADLLGFMKPALVGLVDVLRQVVEWYRSHLKEHGYELNP